MRPCLHLNTMLPGCISPPFRNQLDLLSCLDNSPKYVKIEQPYKTVGPTDVAVILVHVSRNRKVDAYAVNCVRLYQSN